MTVAVIECVAPGNEAAIQAWLDDHTSAVIKFVSIDGNFCYIFHE